MEIELDLFSGVANPRWRLSEAEATYLVSILPAEQEPAPDGLGFRGFILHNPERRFGLPPVLHLGPGRGELAAFLTAQAIHHGYGHLL